MKSVFGAAVFGLASVLLSLGAAAQVGAGDGDGGYGAADAGSLGVELVDLADVYCAADAGSLGLSDPLAACGR